MHRLPEMSYSHEKTPSTQYESRCACTDTLSPSLANHTYLGKHKDHFRDLDVARQARLPRPQGGCRFKQWFPPHPWGPRSLVAAPPPACPTSSAGATEVAQIRQAPRSSPKRSISCVVGTKNPECYTKGSLGSSRGAGGWLSSLRLSRNRRLAGRQV